MSSPCWEQGIHLLWGGKPTFKLAPNVTQLHHTEVISLHWSRCTAMLWFLGQTLLFDNNFITEFCPHTRAPCMPLPLLWDVITLQICCTLPPFLESPSPTDASMWPGNPSSYPSPKVSLYFLCFSFFWMIIYLYTNHLLKFFIPWNGHIWQLKYNKFYQNTKVTIPLTTDISKEFQNEMQPHILLLKTHLAIREEFLALQPLCCKAQHTRKCWVLMVLAFTTTSQQQKTMSYLLHFSIAIKI